MQTMNRRYFISNTSLAIAGIALASSFAMFKKNNPRLSFSTLGCPEWDLPKIVDFAAKNEYDGIEIRGILRELDLTKCSDFSTNKISTTIRMVKDSRLKIIGLGSSAQLHHADTEKRKNSLDEAKKFIDLAHRLNCPYVRVFPDAIPKDQERNETFDLIIKGLLDLADYAAGSKVSVLLESHGDVVRTDDLHYIMKNAGHRHVGMIWDVCNMWSVTKEPPAEVYKKLKKYIRHTHIKDGKMVGGKIQYKLLGRGEIPLFEAIDILSKGGYKGYYSFEWEKLWHPEIEEPEIALADFTQVMRRRSHK